jgi:hypothetical protein
VRDGAGHWEVEFYDFVSGSPGVVTELAGFGDVHERAARNGARHGTPVIVAHTGEVDPRINLFFRTGRAVGRGDRPGRRGVQALEADRPDQRRPDRADQLRHRPGRAEDVLHLGCGPVRRGQPGARRHRDVPSARLRRRPGARPLAGWARCVAACRGAPENEDRDAAFVDGLYGTGLRLSEWASVLDVELPTEQPAGGGSRFPKAWLAAACIKGFHAACCARSPPTSTRRRVPVPRWFAGRSAPSATTACPARGS